MNKKWGRAGSNLTITNVRYFTSLFFFYSFYISISYLNLVENIPLFFLQVKPFSGAFFWS